MERQTITVDISPHRGMVPQLRVSQGDIGRPLGVYIMQDGAALDCSSYTADLYILKADGNYYVEHVTVDSTETNLITWETAEQETPVAGECAGQIRILQGEDDIGTARFVEYVEASPGCSGAGSESAIESLKEYVRQAAASAESASGSASSAHDDAEAAHDDAVAAHNDAVAAHDDAVSAHDDAETASDAAEAAQAVLDSIPADYSQMSEDVTGLKTAINQLNGKKYGVSGVGGSASALTRLWDSVGMIAQVGTDGDNSAVVNDFDSAIPFMRRKCVGKWQSVNGVPVFRVYAYQGDADYAEDGTVGDYVAVECPLAYYYFKNGVLGVSDKRHDGWKPFDIFCRNHNPQDVIPYVYLPAYALALKNGKAVSLPGLDNFQGCYKDVMDACRTYDGDGVQAKAHCQPMAVNFYEWALFTVEFATQNCQSVMQGCTGLRHSNDDRATLRSDGKWLLSNYYASRVAGEYVSIQPTTVDINAVAYYASHKITSIIRCDAEGNESSSGAYQLVTTEDLGSGREYTAGESYRFAARPYRTGECNNVSTPSGSPVSNSDSYHAMRYRWRENVYSNQFKTAADLFNIRVGTGDDDYTLEWYFLPGPSDYTPSSTSKPDATDLASDKFILLDVGTAHANYASGYIKSKQYSEMYPDIWIPGETSGGSSSTYFCDYAYLVNSSVVCAVRLGGAWHSGVSAGFSSLHGHYAPSHAYAYSGGDLFFPQAGVNAA